MMDSIDRKWTI